MRSGPTWSTSGRTGRGRATRRRPRTSTVSSATTARPGRSWPRSPGTAPAADDRLAMETTVLWPTEDPLFPSEWGDRLDEFFTAATVRRLEGVGHFTPLEAPDEFAAAIRAAAR